jgi:ABC-type Fe3+-hydroxamate transport system substrate-binding protein
MAAGHDTFINEMLTRCSFENVFENETSRYPEITNDRIKTASPDLILLSSEPYPFKEKHIDELREICPAAKILLVDGELFSWYGSRLLHSAGYFQSLLSSL